MSDEITALKHEVTRLREKNRQLKASRPSVAIETTAIAVPYETVLVNGCHDCPFRQIKTCHFVGYVTNNWRDETFHDRCPLRTKNILVTDKN